MAWPLLQGGDSCRVHGCSVANSGDGFQRHVAAGDGPLVVLFEHEGADQAGDGCLVRKNSHDIGSPFDFLVQALKRVRRVDFRPVVTRKTLVGQHIVLGAAHQFSELGMTRLKCLDQLDPVFLRRLQGVLIEGGSESRGHDRAVLLADAGERVPHEVDATALDCGPQNL